jgi:hypothetical protein
VELARLTGNPHRKCKVPGCKFVSLDLDDDDMAESLPEDMNELIEKKLTYQQRKHLPKSSFVYPGKRAYPIPDKPHGRNALARVAQHGSPEEKAKVRAKVHHKFPDIGESEAVTEADKWIKGAVSQKHKGYCTPMTKKTCTPRRKALAKRFKSGDLHNESKAEAVVAALLEDEVEE